MDKVFENSSDLHVRATKIYEGEDGYAYDSLGTNGKKIDSKTLIDLFLKGVIIVYGTSMNRPVSLIMLGDVAAITYFIRDTEGNTKLILVTASEYVEPEPELG